MDPDKQPPARPSPFPATRWSVVERAAAGSETERAAALADLCRAYWFPVYAYLRRCGESPHDAEDLTQGFFGMFLRRGDFARADPERGRLRTLLLTALRHYVRDERERAGRIKRGGERVVSISEDAEARFLSVADPGAAADAQFDRHWAMQVLGRAMERLESGQAGDRRRQFEVLREALAGQGDHGFYDGAASVLGQTPAALRVLVHRWRKQLRGFIEDEIRDTTADEEACREELSAFRRALTGS